MQCASLIFITSPRHWQGIGHFPPEQIWSSESPRRTKHVSTDRSKRCFLKRSFSHWQFRSVALATWDTAIDERTHGNLRNMENGWIHPNKDLQHQTYGLDRFGPVSSVIFSLFHFPTLSSNFHTNSGHDCLENGYDKIWQVSVPARKRGDIPNESWSSSSAPQWIYVHLAPPCTTLHPTRLPEVRGPGKQTFLAALLLHGVLRCFISFKWLLPTTPKLAVCSFTTLQCRHKSPGKHLNPWRPPAPSDSCQSSVNPGPWPAACGVHSWAPYLAWRRKWSFYTELLKEYHVVT